MRARHGVARVAGAAVVVVLTGQRGLWWSSTRGESAGRRRRSGVWARALREQAAQGLGGGSGDSAPPVTATTSANTTANGSGLAAAAVPRNALDELLMRRPAHLSGPDRLPLSYDVQMLQDEQARQAREAAAAAEYASMFDENNMPRQRDNADGTTATATPRPRAEWEYEPTPEHRALVLMLYRNLLKSLVKMRSVRRRSLIAYVRFAVRRRAAATEKLLIDECIEECRRALFVLQKHHDMLVTGTYEYDTMFMPKDTGQDVKTYMEDVYDPEVSRQQFQHFADVQPGKEHLHQQNLAPTSGAFHWRNTPLSSNTLQQQQQQQQRGDGASSPLTLRVEDKVFRPPPPPDMLCYGSDDDDEAAAAQRGRRGT